MNILGGVWNGGMKNMNQKISETKEMLESWFLQERFKFWIDVMGKINKKEDQWIHHRIKLAQQNRIDLAYYIDDQVLKSFDEQYLLAESEAMKYLRTSK